MATRNPQLDKNEGDTTRPLSSLSSSASLPSGIDRTVIRGLLKLTPAERARLAVDEARNLMAFERRIRRPRR